MFRNPDKVAPPSADARAFIVFFGTDLAVLAGHEFADRIGAFWTHHATRIRATERSADGEPAAVPQMPLPPELEAVGGMFDEVEGLVMVPECRLVQGVFADPRLIAGHRYREAVSGYLRSESILPVALRRPVGCSAACSGSPVHVAAGREALLRRYKAHYFHRAPLPGVTTVREGS